MTNEEAKSCICTIKMLQKLAYNIHGVMDVVDADNCKKIIKALEQEPRKDEVILTKEEYGELVSSEFDNGYTKGYREALEQNDVLDKIKAEIKGWQDDIHDNENDADKHDFVFERIFEIIDENKAESEG